jgi:hypothetical protein
MNVLGTTNLARTVESYDEVVGYYGDVASLTGIYSSVTEY